MTYIQNGTAVPATVQANDEIAFARMVGGRQKRDVLR
jgi:hypothetical protein